MNDFFQWLAEIDSEKAETGSRHDYRLFHRIWAAAGNVSTPEPPAIDQEWLKLENAIREDAPRTRSAGVGWAMALAAIVVAAILVRFFILAAQPIEYVTERGERLTVNLPDRSIVRLNAVTKLTFSRGFNKEDRSLRLSGEAFFEVEHGKYPFRVHTPETDIEVLGTKFNVYARDGVTLIGVIEGTVRVTDHRGGAFILKKGEMARCLATGFAENKPRPISHVAFPAWIHDQILFQESPLAAVVQEVSRNFAVDIVLDRPDLAVIPVSGLLEAQDPKKVLDALCRMVGAELVLSGDVYHIR